MDTIDRQKLTIVVLIMYMTVLYVLKSYVILFCELDVNMLTVISAYHQVQHVDSYIVNTRYIRGEEGGNIDSYSELIGDNTNNG